MNKDASVKVIGILLAAMLAMCAFYLQQQSAATTKTYEVLRNVDQRLMRVELALEIEAGGNPFEVVE
jgi:hypothetical protein